MIKSLKILNIIVKNIEKRFELLARLVPIRIKRIRELIYWKFIKIKEKGFTFNHYHQLFTNFFHLDNSYYKKKKILDIGCGPRGSLEWADMALERVGLDPLAKHYLKLGANKHKMIYVNAPAEKIPFEENYFDVVSSFNSLDHIDDLELTLKEIKRVLKPGGLFLLITELNHEPTISEPLTFSWDIVKKFEPEFKKIEEIHYEKVMGLYESIRKNLIYNHNNSIKRSGVLKAKFRKK